MSPEHAEARAADQLNLRAHQLVVHLLGQREHGLEPVGAAIDDVLADVDPADAFARALGVLATHIGPDAAASVVVAVRQAIPALILRAEGES